ncbi:MAG: hypothetical protein K6E19_11515 [Lachnospiraceae bacterium]|nr:hypothetical protein [Lachnospiraceae bacterium]
MSAALEALEKAAKKTSITDSEEIRSIINNLLGMDYRNLAYKIKPHSYITNDIGNGFGISSSKVANCSVRELLMLMGCEPGVPWFEIAGEDNCHFRKKMGKDYCSAGHSFTFAIVLLNARKQNKTVDRFMKIDYRAFMDFLLGIVSKSFEETNHAAINRFHMTPGKLSEIESHTKRYMRDHGRSDLYEKPLTLGDLIETACLKGTNSWLFGYEYLDDYLKKIVDSHFVMNGLFMYCIREVMISGGLLDIKELLDKCSDSGEYELFDRIEFQYCFRSLNENKRNEHSR